ncbi:reverse transcriptase domain-containing protein, partial [Tanacetum coccineum]
MTGVPRSITEHKLKIRQGYSPVRQKKRGQAPERAKAILGVMVKKSDGKLAELRDFTDINKSMFQKTATNTRDRLESGVLMRIPLQVLLGRIQGNAGATYQRLVDNAFEGQVGRNLEVYVDDLVIKSHTEDERHVPRIKKRGQAPERAKAILEEVPIQVSRQVTPLVQNTQEVYEEGRLPLDSAEAEEAFTQLKQHIAALPTLVAPRPGEELIMYLSATHGAISAVLLTDRDSIQTPVYFVSKALKETEINYSAMEKLILALVFAAKRLRRYFQAHPIVVIIDQPIKQVISKPDALRRLQKWSVLLGEHNISYRPRTAVKGQILADFLIEKPETDA